MHQKQLAQLDGWRLTDSAASYRPESAGKSDPAGAKLELPVSWDIIS
jgi:hypothetical protein